MTWCHALKTLDFTWQMLIFVSISVVSAFLAPAPIPTVGLHAVATLPAKLTDGVFATDTRPVILFDGVCNLCNFWVNFVLDNDPAPGRLRFAALQSEVGRALLERSGRSPDDISSIVLVTPEDAFIKADAVLRIGEIIKAELPLARLAPFARRFVPSVISDGVYDVVAKNRYRFLGHSDTCRVSDDGFADRFIQSV
ncbi:hypothetical protein CTAYLR_001542 [Chrysophaeum taylorii]|uniref:Thiol-disulfide oxidoreductase DCC n=1 Tax=Chrysophaeum taylorii TaxID=2483200 RepID=A0AAD7UFC7_9STRA|nr:hypothetical protein CTAYLR_001542 [Chrysophaeum taylorii]